MKWGNPNLLQIFLISQFPLEFCQVFAEKKDLQVLRMELKLLQISHPLQNTIYFL